MVIPAELAGTRLDAALAQLFPEWSRSRLTTWIKEQRVTVDGRQLSPKDKLWGAESVRVEPVPDPEQTAFTPEPVDLQVVYEDRSILVLDKPAGLVVHPAAGNWGGTILNGLLYHYPELGTVPRAGIVHRLDKDTSGLMVVARTVAAQTQLVRQLQDRSVGRRYLALVEGDLNTSGVVDAPVGRHPRDRIRMAVVSTGKPARTHYRPLERYGRRTLVECKLETGRTHQIRVHMQKLGFPLVADPLYNGKPLAPTDPAQTMFQAGRQALHAAKLELVHPESGKSMRWRAPLPSDMAELIMALRVQAGLAAEPDDEDWDDDDDNDVECIWMVE